MSFTIIKDFSWKNKCSDEDRNNTYKPPSNNIIKICNNQNVFIALTYNGKIMAKNNNNNYEFINAPANNYWTDIAYGNNRFIAISSDNEWKTSRAITSIDGIKWNFIKMYKNYKNIKETNENGFNESCETETNDFGWQTITFNNKLNIFIAKDLYDNVIWIDSITLKCKLYKYISICFIQPKKLQNKRKKKDIIEKEIIEKNLIYWSFGKL